MLASRQRGDPALTVLLTWSAIVLGFLGGIRWGLESARATPRWTRLATSVISPTVAWTLIFARGSVETSWLLCGFMAAFILQWLYDHAAPANGSTSLLTVLILASFLNTVFTIVGSILSAAMMADVVEDAQARTGPSPIAWAKRLAPASRSLKTSLTAVVR